MDDIILIGNDYVQMVELKNRLVVKFKVKDLGSLRYFLGMEVARNKNGISVSQRKYIFEFLKEIEMLGCKVVNTPMDPLKKIGESEKSIPVDIGTYQQLMGN